MQDDDNLIVFNNKTFMDYLKEIYPSQLTVEKANKSDHLDSFPATYHLALHMVYTFHSSYDIQDAAHTMMILDIATSASTSVTRLYSLAA